MWGYGATYTTTADEVIGTIPIGYADGWTRDLQGFHVVVDGQLCPIVGRVSMDQITVRLPKVYPLGTPVTLMGENGGASITATEVAENVTQSTTRFFAYLVIVSLAVMSKKEKSSLILDFFAFS